MDVTIDGVRSGAWEPMPQDALDALARIADELRGRGRAMVSVSVNGRILRPEEVAAEFSGKPLDTVGTLSIQSEPIAELVAESLDELAQVLPELPQACHRLAEIFQSDDPDAGYEPFHKLAEIWRVIKERELQVLGVLGLDAESLVLSGMPLIKAHEELNRFVEEAAGALEARDCVLLGDLLEYELAPRAEAEAEIVAFLRKKAAQG